MKIEIRNFAGNWESLTCDCGGDEFVAFQEYEKDGETITDFECVRCHEGPHFVGSDGWREAMNPMAQGGNWSIENRDGKAIEYEGDEVVSMTLGRWIKTDEHGNGDWDGAMVEGRSFADDGGQEYRVIR